MFILCDRWNERQSAVGRGIVEIECAFLWSPPEVSSARDQIDLLDAALSDICTEKSAGRRIKRKSPWVPESECVDLFANPATHAHKWIGGGDPVLTARAVDTERIDS